jgi:uncharacterized pyridoxamine 5'-phosphate oxidase family protein
MKRYLIIGIILLFVIPTNIFAAAQVGTINAEQYANDNKVLTFDQLTAATDNTQKIYLLSENNKAIIYKNILWQIKVAGITTNVVYRLEGSLDGDNWFTLHSANITKTADGTYSIDYRGNGQILYIRLYWVSESGGTATTIDVKAKVYGGGL